MIGHVEIIEMRKQGYKPKIVFIFDTGEPNREYHHAAENQLALGCSPEIHISPSDDVYRLDMRFLVGCVVSVTTNCKDRARGLYLCLKRAMVESVTISNGDFLHHEVLNG